ncbi:MAG: hypothetical protein Q4D38_02355 [Planctomycetia bacterium]|nr:hypothetical protein [Planctomycetia bacterium]
MTEITKEARYDAAIAQKEAGNLEAAIEMLESLCADFPEYALPHAALSMIYSRLDAHVPALDHAAIVCELEPEDPFSFVAMSALAIKSGNREAAEEALGKARMAQLKYLQAQTSNNETDG